MAFWVSSDPESAALRFEGYSGQMLRRYPMLRSTTLLPGDVISRAYPDNPALIGLNVGNHPVQGKAVLRMRQMGDSLVTGPIDLAQGGQGLILRTPVWRMEGNQPAAYWGHVSLVFDLSRLQQQLAEHAEESGLVLSLADADGEGVTSTLRLGSLPTAAEGIQRTEFAVPGERWRISAVHREPSSPFAAGWLPLLAGLALACISAVGAALLAVTSARLRESNRRLAHLATTDPLTGAHNRRACLARLRAELSRLRRGGLPLAVALVDVDHFKRVNDTHGHAVGDAVLRGVVEVLRSGTREHDFVARWGGEEFLVLAPQTDARGATELCERLALLVESARWSGVETSVTVSVGIATAELTDTEDSLLERADQALYTAKSRGRNLCVLAPRPRPKLSVPRNPDAV